MIAASGEGPALPPGRYALLAVDAAYMGVCCVNEMAAALEAIAELASASVRSPVDQAKQLAKIKRTALRAHRETAVHLSMFISKHEEAENAYSALKHFKGLGLRAAFEAMDPSAKSDFLKMAREYTESLPASQPVPHLRLLPSHRR